MYKLSGKSTWNSQHGWICTKKAYTAVAGLPVKQGNHGPRHIWLFLAYAHPGMKETSQTIYIVKAGPVQKLWLLSDAMLARTSSQEHSVPTEKKLLSASRNVVISSAEA
jgi:hypothetical protein